MFLDNCYFHHQKVTHPGWFERCKVRSMLTLMIVKMGIGARSINLFSNRNSPYSVEFVEYTNQTAIRVVIGPTLSIQRPPLSGLLHTTLTTSSALLIFLCRVNSRVVHRSGVVNREGKAYLLCTQNSPSGRAKHTFFAHKTVLWSGTFSTTLQQSNL